jgi:hypothetical protein
MDFFKKVTGIVATIESIDNDCYFFKQYFIVLNILKEKKCHRLICVLKKLTTFSQL